MLMKNLLEVTCLLSNHAISLSLLFLFHLSRNKSLRHLPYWLE